MPHTEKTFVAPDAVTVFYRVWKATAPQKATLLFLHGFGEHSGRYEHVFKTFQDAGISVICPDHRGHGKTFELNKETMVKGYVPMAPVFAGYLKLLTEVEAELRGNSPVVVFGHSMGGLLALRFTQLHASSISNFAGVGASAPLLGFFVPWIAQQVLLTVGYWVPNFAISAPLNKEALCNVPSVVEEYLADPLVHDKLATGTAREWQTAINGLMEGAAQYKFPLLITAQPSDLVVPFAPIKELHDKIGGTNKKMVVLEKEYMHEPHNDIGKDKVIALWRDFILERAEAGPWKGGPALARL